MTDLTTESILPPHFPFPWACDWGEDRFGPWVAFRIKGVRQRLRWVPPARFQMGSPANEQERLSNERQHWVTLSSGLWLADTACTQALWKAVMGINPSRFQGAERPVEQVSWEDAQNFFARLNASLSGLELRLPSEAEWEHACRAGTRTAFGFGDTISTDQVNYNGDYPYRDGPKGENRKETVEVTVLPANAWGLYQMHGNVWEWCQDWMGDYPTGDVWDPLGPATGVQRVGRGGSWLAHAANCRAALRGAWHPGYRRGGLGVRLARGPKSRAAEPQQVKQGRLSDLYSEY